MHTLVLEPLAIALLTALTPPLAGQAKEPTPVLQSMVAENAAIETQLVVSGAESRVFQKGKGGRFLTHSLSQQQKELASLELSQVPPPKEDKAILQVEGVLEPGDATLDDGSLYDEYSFDGLAGQAIIITLESDEFDTYLFLLDKAEETIAENDDGDSTTDSSIALVLPNNGTFRVWANAYDSTGKGTYHLRVALTQPDNPLIRKFEADQLNFQGTQLARISNYFDALPLFQQALEIYSDIGDLTGEGTTLNNIGGIYDSLGQYSEALRYYQQALGIRQEIGDRSGEGINLNNIGFIYSRLGQYSEALRYYQQALGIRQEIGDRSGEGTTLNNIGFIYSRLGQYSEALRYYQQALGITQEIGDRSGEATTLHNIGYALEALEYSALAVAYFKESVNAYEDVRAGTQGLSQEDQQSYTDKVANTYRKLADLLLQEDRVLEAQRVLDLLRVQELDDSLRGIRGETTTESGIDLLPQERAFLEQSDSILAKAVPIAAELKDLRAISFQARTEAQNQRILELQDLQSGIGDQFLAFIDSSEVQDLIAQLSRTAQDQDLITRLNDFPNLQNNLADIGNAVLLYPLILDDRLELVLITADGPPTRHPVPVSRTELIQTISDFQGLIRDRASNINTVQQQAQQLYQWLMADLEDALAVAEADTILYSPDGPLRYIPLAALHDGEQWLAQRYRINHITAVSLSDLNLRPSREPQILAGAFVQGRHTVQAAGKTLQFRGLPYAGIEVEELSALFPTTQFVDDAFSRSATEPLFNDHTIVHLATHATLLVGSPLESFILFGNGDRLTLADLKTWDGGSRLNRVELVVLSACETGTGSIKDANGEEILGFGYLIQQAGARAAIASLWPVSDGGTQELMNNFYEVLQVEGVTKAEALRQAQIALITGNQIDAESGERFTLVPRDPDSPDASPSSRLGHPYYWAPFILIGNGL